MAVNSWRMAREDTAWCGPVVVTLIVNDLALPPQSGVQFAVIADQFGLRPVDSDWGDPDPDPDASGEIGVFVGPVIGYGRYGLWARYQDGAGVLIELEPAQCGWITRT